MIKIKNVTTRREHRFLGEPNLDYYVYLMVDEFKVTRGRETVATYTIQEYSVAYATPKETAEHRALEEEIFSRRFLQHAHRRIRDRLTGELVDEPEEIKRAREEVLLIRMFGWSWQEPFAHWKEIRDKYSHLEDFDED